MVINLVKKKFSTGDLSGVHISTIVNETIKTNSNFLKKISAMQKTQNK